MALKFCIWDVGQTIYPYRTDPLKIWLGENTQDLALWREKKDKSFDFMAYMKGEIDTETFCKNLCQTYGVEYKLSYQAEINKVLHAGVGEPFAETLETMSELEKHCIKNGILSNALPMLADTKLNNIKSEYVFTSYELKALKPQPDIYRKVLERLGVRPNEILFVDDKIQNVMTAKDLGSRAVLFKKETVKQDCMDAVRLSQWRDLVSRGGR